ncbi:hypothetical protein BHE74_00015997 [Ensete ventricosum]|nr:hypothetical protein BHE74_00015997 [Ensete ventricosum]
MSRVEVSHPLSTHKLRGKRRIRILSMLLRPRQVQKSYFTDSYAHASRAQHSRTDEGYESGSSPSIASFAGCMIGPSSEKAFGGRLMLRLEDSSCHMRWRGSLRSWMEKWVTPLRKEQGTPLLSEARGSMMAFFLPRHYKESLMSIASSMLSTNGGVGCGISIPALTCPV